MLKEEYIDRSLGDQDAGSLAHRQRLLLPILISLFILAGAIRLYRLDAPGLLLERDFGSAILARDLFYKYSDTVPDWQKAISEETRQNLPLLELPVTEFLVSLLYRVIGSEQIWIARLLTSSFWLIGGVFLYKIAKLFLSTDAAVIGLAFYLLAPLSIIVSRSFQPDALMMLLFLISLFCILKYYEHRSILRLVIAASLTGLTLLHRPLVLQVIFAAFIALAIAEQRSLKSVDWRHVAIFFALCLLPVLLYYGYGALVTDGKQAVMSFQPYLLLHKEYWRGWLDLGISSVGITALFAAILGLAMLPKGRPLALIIGLWIGYLFFGLFFTYHIHTHSYYHAQLIPIVALSFGPVVSLIGSRFRESSERTVVFLALIGVVILTMVLNFRQVRGSLGSKPFIRTETAQAIGEIVDHSSHTVFIAGYYGIPLQYYGELTGSYWPFRIDGPLYRSSDGLEELDVEDRLNSLEFTPEFFVITDFSQYNQYHTDLRDYLINECSLLAKSKEYLIYSDCIDQ